MRFACLGSGSRGNATLIEAGGTRVLVDCGLSVPVLQRRLALLRVDIQTLDAVLVTHEHGDHVRGVPVLARRLGIPVWMTPGTGKGASCLDLRGLRLFNCHAGPFRIGDLEVEPYAVPHDAREPSQFLFRYLGRCLAALTDSGLITPYILERLRPADALLLEFNHDPKMLANGPYPPSLQRRVGGRYGHLSNLQAAELLGWLDRTRLRHLVAAHLSEKNNHPDKAREAVATVSVDLAERLLVADQDRPGPWLEI
jgi:phosphoribosyl 1,2-cyclic phosphodiesterase